jgi:hypothetical protein
MSAHLVSSIDTKDFGAETVRIADLNNDGAHELLFVQSDPCTREGLNIYTNSDLLLLPDLYNATAYSGR